MPNASRSKQQQFVDPLDLRERRYSSERTVSAALIVLGPILGLAWLAALALSVGVIGGVPLALSVLLAGPFSLGGLLLAVSEPRGSAWRVIGYALMWAGIAITVLILQFRWFLN